LFSLLSQICSHVQTNFVEGFKKIKNCLTEINDIKILQAQIAKGDQDAYRQLFTGMHSKLSRFVLAITKSRELTEEIISDVFINIWRKGESLLQVDNLTVYIYISAKNTSFNFLSKINREKTISLDFVDAEAGLPYQNPEEALISKDMNQRIHNAIRDLPPRCRMVFVLIKEHGFSYKEAAEILNLSISTVDNQLVIALKKMAASLKYSYYKTKK
jgi:RNA polymerase sigma-70 factor (family 1)